MKAVVETEFPGCPDGECITRTITAGEIIIGSLAQVAIEQDWAVMLDAEPDSDDEPVDINSMSVADLRDYAAENNIEVGKKDRRHELIEKISASIAARSVTTENPEE